MIMTGMRMREIRDKLDLTQDELAVLLDFHGPRRRMRVSKMETGLQEIDYLRANLLLAMEGGFRPYQSDQSPDRS